MHVAIVDPGVGSVRRPLIAKSEHYFFLAPDNGLLTPILADNSEMEVREIQNKDYRLISSGRTFDGRDLFAPAAAWLTRQRLFTSFGRLVDDFKTLTISKPTWEAMALVGEIVHVDRFGNLTSNLTPDHLKEARDVTKRPNSLILIAGHRIDGLVGSYQEGDAQVPRALINSNGQLEIFLKEASAASLLQFGKKEAVKLT